jgi:hypothetical protein
MPVLAAFLFPVFVFALPLLMLLLLVPGSLSTDEAFLLRVCFPFLCPFSAVLWFIVLHRVATHRRSRYLHQLLVFGATTVLIFILVRLGVYRIG